MPTTVAQNIKGLIYGGFVSLPLVLISLISFLAVTLGNIGLIMLSLGHIVIVPLLTFLSNLLAEFLFPGNPAISITSSDLSYLVPSLGSAHQLQYVIPSYWIAHITFFFTYLFTNATVLYLKDPTPSADPNKVENRKAQTMTAMMLALGLYIALVAFRVMMTGTETWVGTLVGASLVIPVAYGWYELSRVCGARDADIFGILQKILPDNAKDEPPMTCVYNP